MSHPTSDPGDGRKECSRCGKWVYACLHSCKGVPVTPAAWNRMLEDLVDDWHNSDDDRPLHEYLGMAWDEYAAWTSDSQIIPARWLP